MSYFNWNGLAIAFIGATLFQLIHIRLNFIFYVLVFFSKFLICQIKCLSKFFPGVDIKSIALFENLFKIWNLVLNVFELGFTFFLKLHQKFFSSIFFLLDELGQTVHLSMIGSLEAHWTENLWDLLFLHTDHLFRHVVIFASFDIGYP